MRKLKQRLCSLLLCAALAVSLCAPAAAVDTVEESPQTVTNVSYLDEKGETKNCAEAITVTNNDTVWDASKSPSDWYVVQNTVNITGRVTVTGNVHLILADRCTLTVTGGIDVSKGNSLTIYAQSTGVSTMGKLTATTTDVGDAGIGGGDGGAGGTITINGGTVTATSNDIDVSIGAGIGGGASGAGGTITINGGEVTATGGSGAGIGGGDGGNGGTINITGGEVIATSENSGAGIGGGSNSDGTGGNGGKITISGGKVEATGGSGAGIGGGDEGEGGTITISGNADVTATSNYFGAGIGGGQKGAGGTITISGGTVKATSSYDAGIGGGLDGDGGTITISGNADVTATSNNYGAGIGGGQQGAGGKITISGGTVKANSVNGAGIGGGIAGIGGEITINGGTVTATSAGNGAGIGGGMDGESGTFAADGNAFIVASSIKDNGTEKKKQWSGVIFEGTEGGVYGSPTLATDATISTGMTLVIEEGQTLIVGEDVTLTNYGTITGTGTIKGKVINNGTINGVTVQGHSHQWDTAQWSSDATHHWHRCTVTGCAERSGSAAHTPGDWVIDQAATSTEAGQRHKACTVCGYVTATETIPATGGGSGGGGSSGGGSYTPPTYKPEVSQPGQGGSAAAVSPSDPKQGDTVTVTPKPDEGYEVDEITVTDRNGKKVEVTKKPDGTYTFTQPASRVTIEVTYRAAETPWRNPFADVDQGAWYYEAVRFVCKRGLMNGYADGRFAPNDTLSRAQLAQLLFNKEGRPAGSGQSDFTDVAGEAWYSAAVRWAADQGIVGGYGDGSFGPNDPITREQLAVMLWRYAGSPAAGGALDFADTEEISPFAREAMTWAVEQGVMSGFGGGRLGPKGQATRAQTAQMLKNFVENQEGNA